MTSANPILAASGSVVGTQAAPGPRRTLNIAIVNNAVEYYNPRTGGAIATVIRELAGALIARGHTASILTIADANPSYDVGVVHRVADTTLAGKSFPARLVGKLQRNYYRWDYPRYSFYLASVIRTLKAMPPQDVLVVHNDYMLAYHLRRHFGHRVTIVSHVHNEPASAFRYLSQATAATDLFIAISQYIAGRIQQTLGVEPGRIATVLNGVNLARFQPPEAPRANGTCRALFIGRINKDKGPDIAVSAVKRLQSEGLNLTLDVAGPVWWHGEPVEGNPYALSVKQSVEAGVGRFLGDIPRDQVPALMRQYDLLLVPSRWHEPYALVVSEGLASGCAVAGSRRGGIPEVIAGAGELFDPDNFEDVCAAIRRLVTDDAYRALKQRQARLRAEQLSWDRAAHEFEQALLTRVRT